MLGSNLIHGGNRGPRNQNNDFPVFASHGTEPIQPDADVQAHEQI